MEDTQETGASGAGEQSFTAAEVEERVKEANRAIEQSRNATLADLAKLKAKLREFEGVDPEEFKALKTDAERRQHEKLKGEGDWKSLERQMAERHGKAEESWKARESTLTTALERYLIDGALSTEIANSKGLPKGLLPILRPQVRMTEIEGEFIAQVVDAKGNPRIADGKATPMTLRDLVEEARSDEVLARMFEGTGSSGGGASRSAASGGGHVRTIPAGQAWTARDIADIASGKARAS